MRIGEILKEAFGDRFIGFLFLALFPAFVVFMATWEVYGYYSFFWPLVNIAFWLLVIRLSLPKKEDENER